MAAADWVPLVTAIGGVTAAIVTAAGLVGVAAKGASKEELTRLRESNQQLRAELEAARGDADRAKVAQWNLMGHIAALEHVMREGGIRPLDRPPP